MSRGNFLKNRWMMAEESWVERHGQSFKVGWDPRCDEHLQETLVTFRGNGSFRRQTQIPNGLALPFHGPEGLQEVRGLAVGYMLKVVSGQRVRHPLHFSFPVMAPFLVKSGIRHAGQPQMPITFVVQACSSRRREIAQDSSLIKDGRDKIGCNVTSEPPANSHHNNALDPRPSTFFRSRDGQDENLVEQCHRAETATVPATATNGACVWRAEGLAISRRLLLASATESSFVRCSIAAACTGWCSNSLLVAVATSLVAGGVLAIHCFVFSALRSLFASYYSRKFTRTLTHCIIFVDTWEPGRTLLPYNVVNHESITFSQSYQFSSLLDLFFMIARLPLIRFQRHQHSHPSSPSTKKETEFP